MSVDPYTFFDDTNVLAYAHDRHSGHKHAIANQLADDLWDDRSGSRSVQVLQEFYMTVTRKIVTLLSLTDAERIIWALSEWRVHAPNSNDVLAAIEMHRPKRYRCGLQ